MSDPLATRKVFKKAWPYVAAANHTRLPPCSKLQYCPCFFQCMVGGGGCICLIIISPANALEGNPTPRSMGHLTGGLVVHMIFLAHAFSWIGGSSMFCGIKSFQVSQSYTWSAGMSDMPTVCTFLFKTIDWFGVICNVILQKLFPSFLHT